MGLFDRELAFTEVYKLHLSDHVAIREAHCLAQQLRSNLRPIRQTDRFAGRIDYALVGFGYEEANGGPNYYCWHNRIESKLKDDAVTPTERESVLAMLEFWKNETTLEGKLYGPMRNTEMGRAVSNPITGAFGRLAGPLLNFDRLLTLGLPGLRNVISSHLNQVLPSSNEANLYIGLKMSIDLLVEAALMYSQELKTQSQLEASDTMRSNELLEMAVILETLTLRQPETLREALQLFWLYAVCSGVLNFGRMDVYMGPFLARDLDTGRLTEDEALSLIQALWRQIADRGIWFNMRVIVGGLGRPDEEVADRFALLAMEATRTVVETEPQLTLRFYKGMNPALMSKALDVIGEGRTFPMLYNDDINVPAVSTAFNISVSEAEQYLPYGCGEYGIDHTSFGSPNSGFNALKALEAALFNGRDGLTGASLGIETGDFSSFNTFDELFKAYKHQVEYHVDWLAKLHALEYEVEKKEAAHLFLTLLYDRCIEEGRALVDGGAKYLGGIVESIGIVNAADSLTAIKHLVYDEKVLTPERLLEALKANFEGYEAERKALLAVPKYGNDDASADTMFVSVSTHLNSYTQAQASKVGLDYFLMVNINNLANVSAGKQCAASADGRLTGTALANANNPTAGYDKKGPTAFLSSLTKAKPSLHAGYVQNMKFEKRMFIHERNKMEALLQTYWAKGGTQAMITVVGRQDLENAMVEPEKYSNLIVRVGGFSARFVRLDRDLQLDILKRTLN